MRRDIRLSLPDTPGVYRMLRGNGDVLYIGKASSLRKRVNSYFQKRHSHTGNVLEMLTQAKDIDTITTSSALEAAVLESDLVKRHSPPYNTALRERQRKLWFCSRDFRQPMLTVTEPHRLGPLPDRAVIDAVCSISCLLREGAPKGGSQGEYSQSALCVPASQGPDPQCFEAGLEVFRQRYCSLFEEKRPAQAALVLGALLWRQHLNEMEKRRQGGPTEQGSDESRMDDGEDEADPDRQPVWTPEAVAHNLEGAIRSAALMIRRSRWFCMLSEAVLLWCSGGKNSDIGRLMMVVRGGEVVCSREVRSGDTIDLPPGNRRPLLARQQVFDIMTYDRMRVLTTELRRLVSEKRSVLLCLGKSRMLDQHRLAGILPWV